MRVTTRARRRALTLALAAGVLAAAAGCQTPRDGDGGWAAPGDEGPTAPSAAPDDPVSTEPGSGGDDPADPPRADVAPVAADLTVTVDATGEGATTTWTLTCEPVGGDHPDAEAACAAIAAAGGAEAFAPLPRDVVCTEEWGGPQTATVTGTVDGVGVRASFDRHNGCAIGRWDALEPLFGGSGGAL